MNNATHKKLWIIEDMYDLQPVYQSILNDSQIPMELRFYVSFEEFSRFYHKEANLPDLIIADLTLLDGNFIALLNEADISLNTPFLIISASDDYNDINNAFQVGAIDYLLKPFNRNEILAKIERHMSNIEEKNNLSQKTMDALNLTFTDFTNMEIKIIENFNLQENKTLHRNELIKMIWKNMAIHPNTLDVHIYNLRKKLKPNNFTIKAIGNGLFSFLKIK